MKTHLSQLNVTLTGEDILEALRTTNDSTLKKIKESLSIIQAEVKRIKKSKKKKGSLFKLTSKKHHCPQCKTRFQPTGNSQRFCSSKCRDLWEKLKKKRKSRIAPQEKKAMFVGDKPKIEPIVNNHINSVKDPGHVTGKKYRSAENNPFL